MFGRYLNIFTGVVCMAVKIEGTLKIYRSYGILYWKFILCVMACHKLERMFEIKLPKYFMKINYQFKKVSLFY